MKNKKTFTLPILILMFPIVLFSQSVTVIDYTQFSPSSCNIFGVGNSITINGLAHLTNIGQPTYSNADSAIILDANVTLDQTTGLTKDYLGTQYQIAYNFKKGYSYEFDIVAWDQNSSAPKSQLRLDFNNGGNGSTNQCNGAQVIDNSLSGNLKNAQEIYFNIDHGFKPYIYTYAPLSSWQPYLLVAAVPEMGSQYHHIEIKKITIKEFGPAFSLSPTSLAIPCGSSTTQTFTVNNAFTNPENVTYQWNIGSNNGWLYNNAQAPPTITTTTESISLTSNTCGVIPQNFSVTVLINNVPYKTYTYTITSGLPQIQPSINGNTSVCNSENYSMANLPCNATVAWSVSPTGITTPGNATGSTTSLTNNGTSGNVTLTANVTSCGVVNPPITQNVHIGAYQSSDYTLTNNTTNSMYYCVGKTISFSVNGAIASNYSWTLPPGWQTLYGGNGNSYAVVLPTTTPTGTVSTSFTEPCGTAVTKNMFMAYSNNVCTNNDPRYGYSPNPAPSSLNVYVNSAYLTNTFIKQIQLVQVNTGSTVFSQNYSGGYVQNATIYMYSYPTGTYTLRIYDGSVWATYIVMH